MQIIVMVAGGVVLLLALAGFARSVWRAPPKRDRDETSPNGMPSGGTVYPGDSGSPQGGS